MRRPILAGNWKMYKNITETGAFFEKFNPLVATSTHCDVVICPTFVNLQTAVQATRDTTIDIGAQNLFWEKEGAYTGEISGGMLRAAGCKWVLVAHSERRQYFGETNEDARKKIVAALDAGLTPIYCIGEQLEERQADRTHEVLETQFRGGTARMTMDQFSRMVIAYEPCWAIGTGKVATPEMAAEAHRYIREQIRKSFGPDAASACRILYGGSVKPDNIRGLMAQPEIDGGLVGGASLEAVSFASIVNF
jgi:triosephosphate isomerase